MEPLRDLMKKKAPIQGGRQLVQRRVDEANHTVPLKLREKQDANKMS